MVILHIIYRLICVLAFDKHVLHSKLIFLMFISWKKKWYCCNMIFPLNNKRIYFLLLWCFLERDFQPMLHKKVLFTTLYDMMSLRLFFEDQKRWKPGKKLFHTNFRFFTPFAPHHFPWIQLRTTNCSGRKVLDKERTTFENLLFLATTEQD